MAADIGWPRPMRTATSNDGNLAFARQIFTWFSDQDIDAFMAALAPDVEARPSINGAPLLRGRDAVAEWWASIASGDGDLEVRPLDYEARGNCVVVRGYMRQRDGRTLAERQ